MDLPSAWAVLSPPDTGQLTSLPLELKAHGIPVRVALDDAERRHLLIAAGQQDALPEARASVLSVEIRKLAFADQSARYIDICCYNPELNEQFDSVVSDVLDSVADSDEPGTAALEAVARWRRLFVTLDGRRMDPLRQRGLFAELTVLSQVLDAGGSLEHWSGPDRAPHDFELPFECLEVKAVGADSAVTIHGLRQLQSHEGRALSLLLVEVVQDELGSTLGDLIDALRGKVPAPLFNNKLSAAGWRGNPATTAEAWAVKGIVTVPANPEIPHLTEESLLRPVDPAIDKVTYQIETAALMAHASGEVSAHVIARACGAA